jgi:hypothetical protein
MERTSEERLLAVLSHASLFFVPVIVPLVIYLMYKDKSGFVAGHAKEALIVHLALAVAAAIGSMLVIILIGIVILVFVGLAGAVYAVCAILAIIKAANGQEFQYPLTTRWAQRF